MSHKVWLILPFYTLFWTLDNAKFLKLYKEWFGNHKTFLVDLCINFCSSKEVFPIRDSLHSLANIEGM